MSAEYKCYWKLEIEAHGLTKALAVSYALRLLAGMIEEAHAKGHSCGGHNGNASGNFKAVSSPDTAYCEGNL